jgi:exosortase
MTQAVVTPNRARPLALAASFALPLAALLWAYGSTLAEMASRGGSDPTYSHGYLVPLFAAALLWLRRRHLAGARPAPSRWGLALLLAALAVRLVVGTWYYYVWLDPISLLPALAGVCLLAGGWAALRWAWPAVAFLFFMIPLPYDLSLTLAGPLQTLATQASTYALQTLGRPALAEGHVILLNEVELGVVEACSGLRMLVVFFALATALALVMRRPLWERLVVVASAAPIALFVNILRITATGVLHETVGHELADAVFHDLAGWVMMPLALVLLGLEVTVLKYLVVEPPAPLSGSRPAAPVAPRPAAAPAPAAAAAPTTAAPPARRSRRRPSAPAPRPFARR